jgi:hypothetical protein
MSSNFALVLDEIIRLKEEQDTEQAQYCNKLLFNQTMDELETKFNEGQRTPSQIADDSYLTSAYKYIRSFFY